VLRLLETALFRRGVVRLEILLEAFFVLRDADGEGPSLSDMLAKPLRLPLNLTGLVVTSISESWSSSSSASKRPKPRGFLPLRVDDDFVSVVLVLTTAVWRAAAEVDVVWFARDPSPRLGRLKAGMLLYFASRFVNSGGNSSDVRESDVRRTCCGSWGAGVVARRRGCNLAFAGSGGKEVCDANSAYQKRLGSAP
jgi:hypothetical protein